jgi:hypothetical protein
MGDQSRVLPDQRAALRCLAWMAQDEPFDPDLRGQIVVVEARDSLEDISSAVGFEILINSISSCRFSNPGRIRSSPRSATFQLITASMMNELTRIGAIAHPPVTINCHTLPSAAPKFSANPAAISMSSGGQSR